MSAISSLAGGFSAPPNNAFSDLTSEEFVKIIFTELTKQDPLQPNDSKALLDQISSLRQIQSSMDLSNKISTLVSQNELTSASNLIGKFVKGVGTDFKNVEGTVESVIRTRDGALLSLGGNKLLAIDAITSVNERPPEPPEAPRRTPGT
jgi:flagellar basal-body rod modification protein FlgD